MKQRNYSRLSPKRGWSWETPPQPPHAVAETLESDVVVVGGGVSGLAAGARCAQLGLKVSVLEQAELAPGQPKPVAALDSPLLRQLGIDIDKAAAARDWMAVSGSRADERLLWQFLRRSGEALRWLCSLAGEGTRLTLLDGGYRGPGFREYPVAHLLTPQGGGVEEALAPAAILERALETFGGKLYRPVRALWLETAADGRVAAVLARGADGRERRYAARRGVVLATGGIGGDEELMTAFCPLGRKPALRLCAPGGEGRKGDGHRLAYWAGAALELPSWPVAFRNQAYGPYSLFFLHVNRLGRRFMNEDSWEQAKAIRCLMQPGGDYAYTIMDGKWLAEYGARFPLLGGAGVLPPYLAAHGKVWSPFCGLREEVEGAIRAGLGAQADSLEGLAAQLSLPPDTLRETVKRYNVLATFGEDLDYGKRRELLTPVLQPPFYALKWGPALEEVYGGILTDTEMRALDPEGQPVPGLLAVGNAAGGFFGVDHPRLLEGVDTGRALVSALALADGLMKRGGV